MYLERMRDKSTVFTLPDNPDEYTSVKIWHCNYKTLSDIKHFSSLKELGIATIADDNLEFLSSLRYLATLRIIHMPRVKDLSAISRLTSLKYLALETLPSWDASGKRTTVMTLQPLTKLKRIEILTLYGVVPADGDYHCLKQCGTLRELNIAPKRREFAVSLNKLHEARSDLKGKFY